jgi:uncharacterized protein with FMN-binding domain
MFTGCSCISPIGTEDFINSIPLTDPDLSSVSDGTYKGSYTVVPPCGVFVLFRTITVDVHIEARSYEEIDIEQSLVDEDPEWISFRQRIIDEQSLQVDGVTGASYSTIAMKKAIEKAVSEGKNP